MMTVRASRVALITVATVPLLLAEQPVGHPYYPLAVGNSWSYRVYASKPRGQESRVVWRVTRQDKTKAGRTVYQVWPTPMQADDEAMQLTVSGSGVEEVSSRSLVLKWPLTSGDRWVGGNRIRQGQSPPAFEVLYVGRPCSSGSKEFQDCALVEEIDPGTQIRTITTYAKGVGPVEYKYFRIGQNGKQEEVQTVVLDSYSIAR